MKCDVLELKLEVHPIPRGKKILYEIKEIISVNGIEFTGDVDIFAVFNDTHLKDKSEYQKAQYLEDESYYNPEFAQSNRALKRFDGVYSNVYFDTCSCGSAGCAGIWNGVRVYKKKKYFKYVARKRDGYDNGILNSGKFNLTFTKENIIQIRKYIVDFYLSNRDVLKRDFDNTIEYCLALKSSQHLYE